MKNWYVAHLEHAQFFREFQQYEKERTAMLNKYSVEELKKFYAKYKDKYQLNAPSSEHVWEASLRKMCVADLGVYPKIKKKATVWLREHGYNQEIKL